MRRSNSSRSQRINENAFSLSCSSFSSMAAGALLGPRVEKYYQRVRVVMECGLASGGTDLTPCHHAEPRRRRRDRLAQSSMFFSSIVRAQEGIGARSALEAEHGPRLAAAESPAEVRGHGGRAVQNILHGAVMKHD